MFFELLEKEIQKRLTDKVGPGILIEVLPEKENEFRRPFDKGRLSVCYKQSEFEKPRSTNEVSQDEEQTVEVVIQARALRGVHGIYDLAERCRKALIGYRPTNCRKMYAVSFKFEIKEENLWAYIYTFAAKSTMIEECEQEPFSTIEEIKQQSDFNTSTVVDPNPAD